MNEMTATTAASDADRQARIVDDLAQKAAAMASDLRARANQTDADRNVSSEVMRSFSDAGFFKILQPTRYGGYELDYGPIQIVLGDAIGRACGSSAWVLLVVACHSWMLGTFPKEAQDDVWASDPDALLSSGVYPVEGRGQQENGGATISGRWRFSSGVAHVKWALLGTPIFVGQGQPPEMRWCLVPRSDFKIEDTWFVSGLRGTGSNDIVIEKAFIPEHRMVAFGATFAGTAPGGAVNASHIYRLPMFGVFPYNICAPALGIARGALDTCIAQVKARPPKPLGSPQAGMDPVLLRIADAGARIDAAAALISADAREFNDIGRAGRKLTPEQQGRYQRDLSFACQQFTAAIDTIAYLSGAHALFDSNPLQRAIRDMHAINAHVGLRWETVAPNYVQAALGLTPPGRH